MVVFCGLQEPHLQSPRSKLEHSQVALSGVTKILSDAGQESEAKEDSWEFANSGCPEKEENIFDKENRRISGNSYAAFSKTASESPVQ